LSLNYGALHRRALGTRLPGLVGAKVNERDTSALANKNLDNISTLLRTIKKEIQNNSTFVGDKFVSQVRSMKEGKIKEKPIHGQGTNKEIQELRDEGIEVVNLPWISDDH